MFSISLGKNNKKVFNLKQKYLPEESFKYKLKIFNHIKKKGVDIDLTDVSPWVKDVNNSTDLEISSGYTIFYPDPVRDINNFPNYTHIFNFDDIAYIQIDNVDYAFHIGSSDFMKAVKDDNYYIAFSDGTKGVLSIVDENGVLLKEIIFTNNQPENIQIIKCQNSIIIGYFNKDTGVSELVEIIGTQVYTPTIFYFGKADSLKIIKLGDIDFILTYNTEHKAIIQKAKKSSDHTFSLGYPFVFNNDITLFSNSTLIVDNVVILYYDIDDQLKVRNCRLYDDYIGVGLPKIITSSYTYELNIEKLNDKYVYISYFDANSAEIKLSLLKIDNDITIIDKIYEIDEWGDGLVMTTKNDNQFIISYVDYDFNSVYRDVFFIGGEFKEITPDYQEFHIDLTNNDISELKGHNDYWIYYNGVILEKGIVKVE